MSKAIQLAQPDEDFIQSTRDALLEEARNAGAHTILISSEHFHVHDNVADVARILPPEDTRIVIYIRDHSAYLESWYKQQIVALPMTCSFQDFIDMRDVRFSALLRKWIEIYGRERVHISVYNRSELVDGDIVKDIFSQFPEFRDFKKNDEYQEREKNPSISGNLLFVKRVLNMLTDIPRASTIANDLVRLSTVDDTFSGAMHIDEATVERIAFLNRMDRECLKKDFGILLVPRRGERAGAFSPDFSRMRDDIKLLEKASKAQNLSFHKLMRKARSMLKGTPLIGWFE
ncbi:hypothetical protein [Pseudodesulfovibrio tunisiensis]|uniref:hypothetical protein n=1 Tax=Pseudodesulfovibrio tunisiensis TaxID=463192 RepID=UPI001FB2246A|nr:hypothetical protein [Pseudodesulfovibrio tunisiensis]